MKLAEHTRLASKSERTPTQFYSYTLEKMVLDKAMPLEYTHGGHVDLDATLAIYDPPPLTAEQKKWRKVEEDILKSVRHIYESGGMFDLLVFAKGMRVQFRDYLASIAAFGPVAPTDEEYTYVTDFCTLDVKDEGQDGADNLPRIYVDADMHVFIQEMITRRAGDEK